MKSIVQMVAVLSVLCGLAGFGLSYLKMNTASRIESQVLTYVQGPAILEVFRNAENSPISDRKSFTLKDGRKINVFPAKRGNKLTGVALEDFGKGFGGDIGVMVGFDLSTDTLAGIGITTMRETPGLGTKISEKDFLGQFPEQKIPVQLKSQGGEIDAVSGATVSSTGAVTAVANAVKIYQELKPLLLETWK